MAYLEKNGNVVICRYHGKKLYLPLNRPVDVTDQPIHNAESFEDRIAWDKNPDTDYYTVYMTEKCNFECKYCFVRKSGKDSSVQAEQLIQFMHKRGKKKIHIRFFGGEPLLKFEQMKEWVSKFDEMQAMGYSFSYSIVTNGSVLSQEVIDFMLEKHFMVIFSHELNEELQKLNRPATQAVTNKVYENFACLKDTKLIHRTMVRCMIDLNSNVSLIDKVEFAHKLGAKGGVQLDLPNVERDSAFFGDTNTREKLKKEIRDLAHFYLEKMRNREWDYYSIFNFSNNLTKWIYSPKYIDYDCCGFGINGFAVGVDGGLYGCQNMVGMEEFRMGDICKGEIDKEYDTDCDKHESCKKCAIRELCKGRCYYSNYLTQKNIYQACDEVCEIRKEFTAATIYILYELKQDKMLFEDYLTLLKVKERLAR